MDHLTIIFFTEINMNIKKKKKNPELTIIFFLNILAHNFFFQNEVGSQFFFSKMILLTIFFFPKSSRPLPKNKMVCPLPCMHVSGKCQVIFWKLVNDFFFWGGGWLFESVIHFHDNFICSFRYAQTEFGPSDKSFLHTSSWSAWLKYYI